MGNGWYKGILSFDCKPDRYGDRTAVWAELHVRYKDGTEEVIATDESWSVRTGQIRYSEIYMERRLIQMPLISERERYLRCQKPYFVQLH